MARIEKLRATLFSIFGVLVLGMFFLPVLSQHSQSGASTAKVPEAELKIPKPELLVRFKDNNLFDISSDGRLLILYGVLTPKKGRFEKAVEWKAKSGDKMFDNLRVVEWSNGKDLASIHVHTPPTAARVLSDGGVCYRVNIEIGDKKTSHQNIFWDYSVNKTSKSTCSSEPVNKAYRGSNEKYESDAGRFVAVTTREKVKQFLLWSYVRGVVTVERKAGGQKVSIANHPTVKEPLDWPLTGYVYSVAFDKEGKHLITSYEGDTYVWKLP